MTPNFAAIIIFFVIGNNNMFIHKERSTTKQHFRTYTNFINGESENHLSIGHSEMTIRSTKLTVPVNYLQ